jgi:rhamnosyltransferase
MERALPEVTVVLLVHKPGQHEVETAELVKRQDYEGSTKILVIDSSPDRDRPSNIALQKRADRYISISPGTFGHGRTRNRALDVCTSPFIVYLSQDAHPRNTSWLRSLVEPLVASEAEASYGRQEAPDGDPERTATYGYWYPQKPQIKTKASLSELGLRTFHFSDVTSAFKTNLIRRLRFPEHLDAFGKGEDFGIAKRLLDQGHRIAYVPEAVVLHAHKLNPQQTFARYRQIGVVCERLGIFRELRRAGRTRFYSDGLKVTRGLAPSGNGGFRGKATPVLVGALKAAAVACGRVEAHLGR